MMTHGAAAEGAEGAGCGSSIVEVVEILLGKDVEL